MPQRVEVFAPSRLHFGLYSFGHKESRQFGGVGVMIQDPHTHLIAKTARAFNVSGLAPERVKTFAQRWCAFHAISQLPACSLHVAHLPPEHAGLGVGTQLGLSVAAALNHLYDLPMGTPAELALSVGRGLRSAVGTYGFLRGGFIAERGKLPHEAIAPLDVRIPLPNDWRFLMITPRELQGLSGQNELQAFAEIPPVPAETTEKLIAFVRDQLVPAAMNADFNLFANTLTQYCYEAGCCFQAIQGGAYNGSVLAKLVATMQELGAVGVGQSSWGPTLFALFESQTSAELFRSQLAEKLHDLQYECHITSVNQHGVKIITSG
jgi:beta-ribofuranosylaminobenzene 5'-phosphate synthase